MIWGGADEIIIEISVWSLSCVQPFVTSQTVTHKTPQSIEFFKKEYWSGLSFPSPDLPNLGIEPRSPTLQADSLPTEPPGNRKRNRVHNKWAALETSQNLPCQKTVFLKNSRGEGRNFKCTQLSQVAGLGRCWSRGVPRGRTSLAWDLQQTSDNLTDDWRDFFFFFLIFLWDKLKT